MKFDSLRPWVAPTAAAVAFLFATANWIDWLKSARATADATRAIAELKRSGASDAPITGKDGIEAELNQSARDVGIRRLTSITSTERDGRPETRIEWEADLRSSLAYLALLRNRQMAGEIPQLSLAALENGSGLIRGRASLRPGAVTSGIPVPSTTTALRDPFRPLWRNDVQFARLASENVRRQEEERRRQQEREENLRRQQEAAQQEQVRRRAFQTRYALTGIVCDEKGPIAFLAGQQRSVMARAGDQLEGARVVSIDQQSGEVTLESDESLSVILKLGSTVGRP